MSSQSGNSHLETTAIREALNSHSLLVENNINKIRYLIILIGAVSDTSFLTLSGRVDLFKGLFLPLTVISLIVMTTYFLIIHRLTVGNTYRAWVKYLVVTIDYGIIFITFFDMFHREEFKAMFSIQEMLWMSCFSLIMINSLSILRVEKRVIIYGTVLALIINSILFSIVDDFPLVLLYGSLSGILFFGIFNIWIARNVAKRLASTVRLNMTRNELTQANRQLSETLDELKNTQTQLVQSEKMAALGKLAAGIAHEVNNPIGAIISSADVIKRCGVTIEKSLHGDEAENELQIRHPKLNTLVTLVNENCETILLAGSRVSEIIKSMKNFIRLDEATYQKVNIHEGIESTLAILRHETKNITIVKEFGSIPKINCFPNQLNQVFMNLIMNALQAMSGTGRITIATELAGDAVVIKLTDSGPGISPENLDKIFDAGFTTKGVGVGTGLGLSISYAIVKKHHGTITVDSKTGEGTTFIITLPST